MKGDAASFLLRKEHPRLAPFLQPFSSLFLHRHDRAGNILRRKGIVCETLQKDWKNGPVLRQAGRSPRKPQTFLTFEPAGSPLPNTGLIPIRRITSPADAAFSPPIRTIYCTKVCLRKKPMVVGRHTKSG